MRWVGEALRGAWTALAAHPIVFASVTLAVAALNVVAPVAILSAVRKPFDFYTFNPWLKRLPEYFASDDAPLVEKLAKLPDLALFWVSAGSTYGGAEWGFAVDVTDVGRILLVSALFGLYFALWRRYRDLALGGAARALHRGGLAGAAATVFGVSTGACSVTGRVGPGDPRARPRVRRARERHAAFSRRVLARRDDRPPRRACSRRRLPRLQYMRCKRKWQKMTV